MQLPNIKKRHAETVAASRDRRNDATCLLDGQTCEDLWHKADISLPHPQASAYYKKDNNKKNARENGPWSSMDMEDPHRITSEMQCITRKGVN